MNAIYDFLTAKKKAMEAQAALLEVGVDVKPKYEYDSDEDTEGGTWEHKKRMAEMAATKGKNRWLQWKSNPRSTTKLNNM